MPALLPYDDKLVRDLAWVLQSPPLLARKDRDVHWPGPDWFESAYNDFQDPLRSLDRDPTPLRQLLATRKDHRLGSYFETLLQYWLRNNARYRLLHANLPIRNREKTLGEFDLIVYDELTCKTLHWEVAVKFYLGTGDTARPENWWGPARHDRLDLKTNHLLTHQGRLSALPEAQALLAEKGLSIDATWLFMKGRLFYPHAAGHTAPHGAEPAHLHGYWLPAARLRQLPEGPWLVLDKSRWLAPVRLTDGNSLPRRALIDWWRSHPQPHPRCIATANEAGETARVFVVPDAWGKQ